MAFATTADVATRLGRALTAAEQAMAQQVIDSVTAQISAVVNEGSEWATALDPVPEVFKSLCIEKVIYIGSNPNGIASESETLGAYTHSQTFPRSMDSYGVLLTDEEKRSVRQAVWGVVRSVSLESPYSGTNASALDFSEL